LAIKCGNSILPVGCKPVFIFAKNIVRYLLKNRALLNPVLVLDGKAPHVIDEWQEVYLL